MTLTFEQDYFSSRKYSLKEEHVKRHVLEVLRWALKTADCNLLDGQGKRALDVGCAYGYTSKMLAELGYETFGVGISKWGINQAKNLSGNLDYSMLKVETFYDLAVKSGGKLFFKSFNIPNYRLTVRIVVKK
jgi:2-polyprenyl-3-methyl-5-hydroxy-6-metoxy-1,4-benzoquinol methylase